LAQNLLISIRKKKGLTTMTSILSTLFSGFTPQQINDGKNISNSNAEYIAPKNNKQEKTAALGAAAETPNAPPHLSKVEQTKTLFNTQQIAQDSNKTDKTANSNYNNAVTAFQKYMEMSPEERYFEAFLKKEGLTQEQFDALPPEEKEALLDKFNDYVKQQNEEARLKQQEKELTGQTS